MNGSVREQTSRFDSITQYYDKSWFDYRFVWLNRRNLAIHFGYYDDQHRTHAAALENLNRVLANHADIQPGHRVLDAGCGIGGSAIWLAEQRAAKVVGITPVHSQLERALKSVYSRGVADAVYLARADYGNTCFPDESFDVVWAMESLCHAPVKAKVYAEFQRVLKPGGRLVIAEYMRSSRHLSAAHEQLIHDWLSTWAIPDIDTTDEHESAAMAAGLVDVISHDVTANVRPSLRRLYTLTHLGKPIDRLLKKIGFRNHSLNVDGARRQYQALREGIWRYRILTASKPR